MHYNGFFSYIITYWLYTGHPVLFSMKAGHGKQQGHIVIKPESDSAEAIRRKLLRQVGIRPLSHSVEKLDDHQCISKKAI